MGHRPFSEYSACGRRERRQDIPENCVKHYRVTEVIDYSPFEIKVAVWKAQAVLYSII